MATISEEEKRKLQKHMKKKQPETHSFVQESIALSLFPFSFSVNLSVSVSSGFEKLDVSRVTRRTLDVENPALSITLPYDEWIQRNEKKMEKLRVDQAVLLENDGLS